MTLDALAYEQQLRFLADRQEWFDELQEKVDEALATLPEDLRDMVERYYGLNGKPRMTLLEIAELHGSHCPERTRQKLEKAYRKLRHVARRRFWGRFYRSGSYSYQPPPKSKRKPRRVVPVEPTDHFWVPGDWLINPEEPCEEEPREDTPEETAFRSAALKHFSGIDDFIMNGQIYSQKDIKCLNCKSDLQKRMTMAHDHGGQLHKGMKMVCSVCGHVQVLGDTEWRPATPEDIKRLSAQDQRVLQIILRNLEAKHKAGAEWTPFEQR